MVALRCNDCMFLSRPDATRVLTLTLVPGRVLGPHGGYASWRPHGRCYVHDTKHAIGSSFGSSSIGVLALVPDAYEKWSRREYPPTLPVIWMIQVSLYSTRLRKSPQRADHPPRNPDPMALYLDARDVTVQRTPAAMCVDSLYAARALLEIGRQR